LNSAFVKALFEKKKRGNPNFVHEHGSERAVRQLLADADIEPARHCDKERSIHSQNFHHKLPPENLFFDYKRGGSVSSDERCAVLEHTKKRGQPELALAPVDCLAVATLPETTLPLNAPILLSAEPHDPCGER
jgi:hypothetical protein